MYFYQSERKEKFLRHDKGVHISCHHNVVFTHEVQVKGEDPDARKKEVSRELRRRDRFYKATNKEIITKEYQAFLLLSLEYDSHPLLQPPVNSNILAAFIG
jgi:hypothetical protein